MKKLSVRVLEADMVKAYNMNNKSSKHTFVKYEANLKIGRGSTYNTFSYINARYGLVIGDNTMIGPSCCILTTNHVIKNINVEQNANDKNSWCAEDPSKRIEGKKIIIGSDVWIGAGVIILAGSIIPDKCVIGAGTIITESNSKKLRAGDIVVNDTKLRILGNRETYE